MTIEEWFKEWKKAVQAGNFMAMISLLHWGLQLIPYSGKDNDTIGMLSHYLFVADGHNSPKNFVGSDYKQATMFGNLTGQEVLRTLADKAWMELCNRVFVFSNDDGYGDNMKYGSYFLTPKLAELFIRFIDPDRWSDGRFWHCDQANLDRDGKSAYDTKAVAFARHFLAYAWDSRLVLERWHGVVFRDLDEEEQTSLDNRIKFFHSLKPTLARLMVSYDMTTFLHDRPLNHPTRRVLWEIAQRGQLRHVAQAGLKVDLAQVYGELTSKGYPANSHREVIRVLQLYPLLVAGRKSYIREQNKRNADVRAAIIAEAERKLAEATAALQQLK